MSIRSWIICSVIIVVGLLVLAPGALLVGLALIGGYTLLKLALK